jgi:FtsZ-interacting cell division protein YlmF
MKHKLHGFQVEERMRRRKKEEEETEEENEEEEGEKKKKEVEVEEEKKERNKKKRRERERERDYSATSVNNFSGTNIRQILANLLNIIMLMFGKCGWPEKTAGLRNIIVE